MQSSVLPLNLINEKKKGETMSNYTKELKGIEMYMYFISHFEMTADEAAKEMKEHGHYTDDVCKAHTMLNKHMLKQKGE
jgi:hypothetical protein